MGQWQRSAGTIGLIRRNGDGCDPTPRLKCHKSADAHPMSADITPELPPEVMPELMPDLRLTGMGDSFQLTATSVLGMLWLQTHFETSTWDLICSGTVRISASSSLALQQDACAAGLQVTRIPAATRA